MHTSRWHKHFGRIGGKASILKMFKKKKKKMLRVSHCDRQLHHCPAYADKCKATLSSAENRTKSNILFSGIDTAQLDESYSICGHERKNQEKYIFSNRLPIILLGNCCFHDRSIRRLKSCHRNAFHCHSKEWRQIE